jgi:hypothetical protein
LGVIGDESEVEDVLYEALLQVWEQGCRYNPSEKGLRGLFVSGEGPLIDTRPKA